MVTVTPVTSNTILNRAINMMGGNQKPVAGQWPNFDDSPSGIAGNYLYQGVVQTVGRQFGYDFARQVAALQKSGNPAPLGWDFEYIYPSNGIQVRQVVPPQDANTDENDPLPVNWVEGSGTLPSGTPSKLIWSDTDAAIAVFTGQPIEALWDSLFTEAVVRLLSSELAQAVSGKPETAAQNLQSAEKFGALGTTRDS